MADWRDLVQKREQLASQAEAILNTLDVADKKFDEKMAAADKLLAEAKRVQELVKAEEKKLGLRGESPPPVDIGYLDGRGPGAFGLGVSGVAAGPARGKTFRAMFGDRLDSGGFNGMEDFLSAVHNSTKVADARLSGRVNAAMREGTPSDGGFLVPDELAAMLLDKSIESEIVRPLAQAWPMKSETRKIPAWAGDDHTGSLFGGFVGVWLAELATATRQTPKVRQITLTARKLGCYTQTSNELLADGVSFEETLGTALIKAIGFYLDVAFLTGTGAGQPLGVLNSPSLVTVAKESGQAAKTIVYENLTKMFARLAPGCLANSVWVANQDTIPQLLSLTQPVGTGGSAVPVLNQTSGEFRILTRPVKFTEKVPGLGTVGDIMLVDFTQYAVGLRKEVTLDRSNSPGWLQDASDYRAIVRADGQATWDKPITPRESTDTLSWAVCLATRA